MVREFSQTVWNESLEAECRQLVQLAFAEDLGGQQDWTTVALVPADKVGAAMIVARELGVAAGLPCIQIVIDEFRASLQAELLLEEGEAFEKGTSLARLSGNVRDLLTTERTILNFLGRLMGIATLTREFARAIAGTKARLYDTRKTTPGWRRLEKYAVRCGGGHNHRIGLYDAILIKDNHLAQRSDAAIGSPADAAAAVFDAREFLRSRSAKKPFSEMPIEVEVDSLEQCRAVLAAAPDIVLLDNMSPALLREAVKMRDEMAPKVDLEASGGVRLETIREIALTGIDRISVGALTHSPRSLDIGLDWEA